MNNGKKFFQTFYRSKSHITLTGVMVILWILGASIDVVVFSQLSTSLAIAVLLYLLVEGASKLDDTQNFIHATIASSIERAQKNTADLLKSILEEVCREKIAHVGGMLKKEHLHEILLAAAVPAAKREDVLGQQELQKYTAEVLERYLNSLSKCQFYEKLHIKCDVTHEESPCVVDGGNIRKKFVKNEIDVEITFRRFGAEPFLIEVEIDAETEAEIKHIIMGNEQFVEGRDYEIVASSSRNASGMRVEFKSDRWKKYDLATVSYKMMYREFDHWTHFAWVAKYPVRSMTVDFRCHDGLTKKDFIDVCENIVRKDSFDSSETSDMMIECRTLQEGKESHYEVITVGWLMPGQGFTIVLSDSEKLEFSDFQH